MQYISIKQIKIRKNTNNLLAELNIVFFDLK